MGTPYYVSPEQAEGRKDIDLRADIYSLGCTLYHLVSGKTPFTGDNAVQVMMKHVSSAPPDIRAVFPACPPVLAEVILKMMQKDPAARQQDYAEVNADLRRAFDTMNEPLGMATMGRPAAGVTGVMASSVAAQAGGKKGGSRAGVWIVAGVAACAAVGALIYVAPWRACRKPRWTNHSRTRWG